MPGKPRKLSELAAMVKGECVGDLDPIISGVQDIEVAGNGELAFVVDVKNGLPRVAASGATAFVVPSAMPPLDRPVIRAANPILATTLIQHCFAETTVVPAGIHASAVVGRDCRLPESVAVVPGVIIGDRVVLGERVVLHAGVVLGDDVVVDDDTVLWANVTVYSGCRLGKRVIIHSGAVIGSDGFGFVYDPEAKRHVKRIHQGIVQIDDDVEIGANSCVDRATFGKTLIRRGTKIDNLVQVAHNVEIGEDCLLAGQAGLAGSVNLGNGVVLAGQAAIKDHVRIGDGVTVAAKAGVVTDIAPHTVVSGMPAIPHKKWLKSMVVFPELSDLLKEIRQLKKRVAELETRNGSADTKG